MSIEQQWNIYFVNYLTSRSHLKYFDGLKDAFYNGIAFLFNQLSEVYNEDEPTFNDLLDEILNELIEYNENLECNKK